MTQWSNYITINNIKNIKLWKAVHIYITFTLIMEQENDPLDYQNIFFFNDKTYWAFNTLTQTGVP